MRTRGRYLFAVVCLLIALLGVSASAFAGWSWCTTGCPPGLVKNGNEKPYEATDDMLSDVHPGMGNTQHTTGRNPHAESSGN